MNPSTKNNLLVWLVVILVIMNAVVLGTIWFMHHHPPGPKDSPAAFMSKKLGFDKDQEERLHELVTRHHYQADSIQEKVRSGRDHLFALLQQKDVSDSVKTQLANDIGNSLSALELITFSHFRDVRNLCTPDQQKKFDEIIGEVLHMMGPKDGPPHGPLPPR